MKTTKEIYALMVKKASPNSPKIKNFLYAFIIGGLICALGQGILNLYLMLNLSEENAKLLVPVTLVFITAFLTGIGVFDNIAKIAGAGTLVPITGFANAVVSPAIEFKHEGYILGVGANIFKIAGPVIAYGISAGVVYGIIYWVTTLF